MAWLQPISVLLQVPAHCSTYIFLVFTNTRPTPRLSITYIYLVVASIRLTPWPCSIYIYTWLQPVYSRSLFNLYIPYCNQYTSYSRSLLNICRPCCKVSVRPTPGLCSTFTYQLLQPVFVLIQVSAQPKYLVGISIGPAPYHYSTYIYLVATSIRPNQGLWLTFVYLVATSIRPTPGLCSTMNGKQKFSGLNMCFTLNNKINHFNRLNQIIIQSIPFIFK